VGRGIVQFRLILEELRKGGDHTVTSVALDSGLAAALEKEGFQPKDVAGYHTKNMLRVLRQEKPDIIMTDCSASATINMIRAARHAGVPALMIDCGIRFDSSLVTEAYNEHRLRKVAAWFKSTQKFQSVPFSLATLPATNGLKFPVSLAGDVLGFLKGMPAYVEGLDMAVLSPSAKEWFIKDGFPAERLFVIGQPRFDQIQKQKYNPAKLRAELNIAADKGIIVLATQPMVECNFWTEKERQKFIETAAVGVKGLPDRQLIVKLHPDEKIEDYRRILAGIGDKSNIVCQGTDMYELLNACDVLITYYSTVALEAMLFHKPVITLNLFGKPDVFPYAQSGAALGVYREEEFVPAVRKAIYDENARAELAVKSREFAEAQIYKPDGQASKRGADLILKLVREAQDNKKIV
jgi:hypothetical protein